MLAKKNSAQTRNNLSTSTCTLRLNFPFPRNCSPRSTKLKRVQRIYFPATYRYRPPRPESNSEIVSKYTEEEAINFTRLAARPHTSLSLSLHLTSKSKRSAHIPIYIYFHPTKIQSVPDGPKVRSCTQTSLRSANIIYVTRRKTGLTTPSLARLRARAPRPRNQNVGAPLLRDCCYMATWVDLFSADFARMLIGPG